MNNITMHPVNLPLLWIKGRKFSKIKYIFLYGNIKPALGPELPTQGPLSS